MPNEEAETLDRYCKEKGYTKAGFIRQAIKDKMERNEQDIQKQCVLFFYAKYTSTNVQFAQNLNGNIGTIAYCKYTGTSI